MRWGTPLIAPQVCMCGPGRAGERGATARAPAQNCCSLQPPAQASQPPVTTAAPSARTSAGTASAVTPPCPPGRRCGRGVGWGGAGSGGVKGLPGGEVGADQGTEGPQVWSASAAASDSHQCVEWAGEGGRPKVLPQTQSAAASYARACGVGDRCRVPDDGRDGRTCPS